TLYYLHHPRALHSLPHDALPISMPAWLPGAGKASRQSTMATATRHIDIPRCIPCRARVSAVHRRTASAIAPRRRMLASGTRERRMEHINWLAVLAAAVSAFVLGGIW